ncbi:MAG TPA: hypothetical protein VKP66_06240 [Steroidobacteraceae bacterium]|nr:hypothetical protein [Steroidobacteraceae bacterium]
MIGVIGIATWALSHSYRGLFHDAGLYTLQALARLHPDSLREDVFLKFGSQDGLTIFSPIYAAASRLLGVEPAAATLTLLLQWALLAGAWRLARAVLPLSMAVFGVVVLIALPGDYGPDRIFTCIEPFLTPRMAAEALVLGSLAAALWQRKALAISLAIGAVLIHPVMAMAGACALVFLFLGRPKPRLTGAMAVLGFIILAMAAYVMAPGEWGRFDPHWLALIEHRSPYLFIAHWQLDDWSRAAVMLATLGVGFRVLPNERARALSLISIVTVLTGLALTVVACDLLHLVLLTQLQPWRWQWLGTVVAALLVPEIVRTLWQNAAPARPAPGQSASARLTTARRPAGQRAAGHRTTALLLISAWVFASNSSALFASAAALAAILGLHKLKSSEARWVFFGACALLVVAVAWRLASNLQFTEAYYLDRSIPLWLRRASSFVHDGAAPVAAVALAFWLARMARGRTALFLIGGLAGAACVAVFPQTWKSWTAREFPPQQLAQFSVFRERIPPGADVFWPESPLAVWVLLQRPSYLSVIQTSGMVFSRRSALELERRADALGGAMNPATFMSWSAGTAMMLSPQQLKQSCATGEFHYLVSRGDLGITPIAELPSATTSGSTTASGSAPAPEVAEKKIRLYRCPMPAPIPAAAQALAAAAT